MIVQIKAASKMLIPFALVIFFQFLGALAIGSIAASDVGANDGLISSENRARLSRVRILSAGRSIKSKCNLYEWEIKQIFNSNDDDDRNSLFSKAIESLAQNKQILAAHKALAEELEQCRDSSRVEKRNIHQQDSSAKNRDSSPAVRELEKKLEQLDKAAASDRMILEEQLASERRRTSELEEELRKSREEVKAQVEATEKQQRVEELEKKLEQLDQAAAGDKASLEVQLAAERRRTSDLEKELEKSRDQVRAQAELAKASQTAEELEKKLEQFKQAAASEQASLEVQLAAERRRAMELEADLRTKEQAIDEANRAAKLVAEQDRLIEDPVDRVVELYKNFPANDMSHCFKYNLVLRDQKPMKLSEIKIVARLSYAGIEVLKYNMDQSFKVQMANLYHAIKARNNPEYERLQVEIHACGGFNSCEGGTCCRNCRVLDVSPGQQKRIHYDPRY